MSKPGLFDYVNEINQGKTNLAALSDDGRRGYNAFMINRALSQHHETVIPAQIMNFYHELASDMQMEYLIQSITKKKRFSKWAKADKSDYLESVMHYYEVSRQKAADMIDLLDTDELVEIDRWHTDTGGLVK